MGVAEYSISEQFSAKRVLLTGATGYVGSLLLECLLRTTDVAVVYVLLRPSGSKSAEQRLKQLWTKNLFHKVRDQESLIGKVLAVAGDLSLPDLGLTGTDKAKLLNNVNIIIHSAADIRLEVDIQTTLRSNYMGTQNILKLAASAPNLSAMVHVSTAFVNMNQPRSSIVDEKLYPLHYGTRRVDAKEVVQELLALPPAAANDRAYALAQRWGFPNNYTLGKHLTEQLVATYHQQLNLQVAIVRPSLVCAVAFEPIPGYIGNWAGPIGAAAAMATGLYHSLRCVSSQPLHVWDAVPGDMIVGVVLATAAAVSAHVDGSIAAAAQAARQADGARETASAVDSDSGQPLLVVHACSSSTYPMTLMEGWNHAVEFMAAHPPKFRISRGALPRMTPDFVPRPEVVRRERRWTAFKVWLLCTLLRLFGLKRPAQRLANGFQALCLMSGKNDKDIIFTSYALEELEANLKSREQQQYLLVWRPGAKGPAAGAAAPGEVKLMSWRRYNHTQLAGVYSMLYRMTVPSSVEHDGEVLEHDFKFIK